MFAAITNTPRDYAWGSAGAISELLGAQASGKPEAELWLGAHPGSPSRIVGSDDTLLDVVTGRLPFLLKVLAAGSPLSLQAHPTMEQAAAGFERENAAGIPIDAPERNYKDAFHKPELIYALSDEFHALCGFRSAAEIRGIIADLMSKDAARATPLQGLLDRLPSNDSLRDVFEWLITRGAGVDELVALVVDLADDSTPELATVLSLASAYPGDPGIVISLMLNRVTLAKGECLYLPAGNIHAYLDGLGIELMASSDNVLRGGLTPKHIDVPELLAVLDFRPLPVPYLRAETPAAGVRVFRPGVRDFVLTVVEVGEDAPASVEVSESFIALCTRGELLLVDGTESTALARGGAVFATGVGARVDITGTGTAFIAWSPLT